MSWRPVLIPFGAYYEHGDVGIGAGDVREQAAKREAENLNKLGVVRSTETGRRGPVGYVSGYWFIRWYDEPEVNDFGEVSP